MPAKLRNSRSRVKATTVALVYEDKSNGNSNIKKKKNVQKNQKMKH